MGAVRQLVDELRRRGVTVQEWPGWDGRGNADGGVGPRVAQIQPVGAVIHHTGSNYGSAYAGLVSSTRPELLGGCLCNFAGNEDGSLTVIASGLAWHAGPGVGPSLGRVLSKVSNIRSRMNRVTVGLEIVYPGTAPMRPAQYRTATVFAKAVADLFAGGDIECVRAHAETNGNAPGGSGKWDPGFAPSRTIDMAAFRRDAAALTGDDMPLTDDDIRRIYNYGFEKVDATGKPTGRGVNLAEFLKWDDAKIGTVLDGNAKLQGQLAGLSAALTQLAAAPGQAIDLDAITAAAKAGAEAALAAGVAVDVTVGGKPAAS